jgi:pyruvate/2-oxoglutarate/acetoin dehydrogenase E1 component
MAYESVTATGRIITVSHATDGSDIKVTVSGQRWMQEAFDDMDAAMALVRRATTADKRRKSKTA